jgi:hypothetical protein
MKSLIKSLAFIALVTLVSVPSFAYLTTMPSYIDFGTTKAGSFGGYRTVTIINQGDKPVSISVTPMCSMEFSVSNGCFGQMYAHSSCSVSIRYSPYKPGYDTCNISVRDNLGDYSSISVSGRAQ